MSSTASLDHLARTSFPSHLPTATASSPIDENPPPFPDADDPNSSEPKNAIKQLLNTTDSTITRLLAVLSTPAGTDRLLCATTYTLTLLSALITNRLDAATERLATQIAANASKALLPGETVIATIEPPPVARFLARIAMNSRKMSTLISDYRIFVRLWGLLGIYAWGKSVYVSPPKDAIQRWISYTQVGVNIAYQALENRAYLAGKTILFENRDANAQLRDWCWSSRFWCAHTVLEFARLWRQKKIWETEKRKAAASGKGEGAWWKNNGSGEDAEAVALKKAEKEEEERLWWKDLIVNGVYFPMTLHWSSEEGLLSEVQVGVLGMIAGGMGLREMWNKSA